MESIRNKYLSKDKNVVRQAIITTLVNKTSTKNMIGNLSRNTFLVGTILSIVGFIENCTLAT